MKPAAFKSLFGLFISMVIVGALLGLAIYGLVAVLLYKIIVHM